MLINLVSALLFFNINSIANIGYSQALKVDFQRLVAIQQAGASLFAFYVQMSFNSVDNLKIMTQSLIEAEGCQKIEGSLSPHSGYVTRLYHWSCD
ncbi:hypothetical protein BZG30_31305 [Escherichia coli]|nr:hypothetical protein [Escherichia coli]